MTWEFTESELPYLLLTLCITLMNLFYFAGFTSICMDEISAVP